MVLCSALLRRRWRDRECRGEIRERRSDTPEGGRSAAEAVERQRLYRREYVCVCVYLCVKEKEKEGMKERDARRRKLTML